jgi:hypothetical protein
MDATIAGAADVHVLDVPSISLDLSYGNWSISVSNKKKGQNVLTWLADPE